MPPLPSRHRKEFADSGGTKERVHHLPTNTERVHHNQHHLHLECQLCHVVAMSNFEGPKSTICYLDMFIQMLHFPAHNFPVFMHVPRIAHTIQNRIPICSLIKKHLLVSTLSTVWWCSSHSFWRPEQLIERTCQWEQALKEGNGIFECIVIYNKQRL